MTIVDGLAAAVDAVCEADPASLGDGATIVAVQRQLDRLEAACTRAAAAFDAGRAWEADGARTASAWMAAHCRLPVSTARGRIRLGRALRHLPAAEAAWLGGDINRCHVGLLADARTPATAPFLDRDEAMLVEQAEKLTFKQFVRALAYWAQLADPDGADERAEAQHEARSLHMSQTLGGSWVLNGTFDPINGSIVATALTRIEDELFKKDWAEAKDRVGDGVCNGDLPRTPAQRRADALVEMARRAMAMPAGSRLPEPLLSVFVGYETFAGRICQLANGTVVAPGSLLPWLDRTLVERVVFDGPDRVAGVGVRQRLFTGATRRAVELRDRECFHDTCDEPAERCEIDHVEPWSSGGQTVEANGRVACGFHNRERHRPPEPP